MTPENSSCPVCKREGLPLNSEKCPQCDADLTCFHALDSLADSGGQSKQTKSGRFKSAASVFLIAVSILLVSLCWSMKKSIEDLELRLAELSAEVKAARRVPAQLGDNADRLPEDLLSAIEELQGVHADELRQVREELSASSAAIEQIAATLQTMQTGGTQRIAAIGEQEKPQKQIVEQQVPVGIKGGELVASLTPAEVSGEQEKPQRQPVDQQSSTEIKGGALVAPPTPAEVPDEQEKPQEQPVDQQAPAEIKGGELIAPLTPAEVPDEQEKQSAPVAEKAGVAVAVQEMPQPPVQEETQEPMAIPTDNRMDNTTVKPDAVAQQASADILINQIVETDTMLDKSANKDSGAPPFLPRPPADHELKKPDAPIATIDVKMLVTVQTLEAELPSFAKLPPFAQAETVQPVAQQADSDTFVYQAKKTDTLWGIAKRFYGKGRYYPVIMEQNPLLRINDIGAKSIMALFSDPAPVPNIYADKTGRKDGLLFWKYTVQPGDTQESISSRFSLSSQQKLFFKDGQQVHPGDTLKIILQ